MKSSRTTITWGAALVVASLLAACGNPDEGPAQAPAEPPAESPAKSTSPAAEAPAGDAAKAEPARSLPATCALLWPGELQKLTGLAAKRWKRGQLDTESPRLSACAWRLDGDQPIILTLTVRTNPNPKKRTQWAAKILQGLLAEGRKDKKGTIFAYETVPGLGDLAVWSKQDGQLRWSEDNLFLFTLHSQKAELLTLEQFLAVAQAVSSKAQP